MVNISGDKSISNVLTWVVSNKIYLSCFNVYNNLHRYPREYLVYTHGKSTHQPTYIPTSTTVGTYPLWVWVWVSPQTPMGIPTLLPSES